MNLFANVFINDLRYHFDLEANRDTKRDLFEFILL